MVENVEEIGIPKLTTRQIEKLCLTAEKAAREYILSRIPEKRIETLNISVETEGVKPVAVTVDIEISLSPLMKNFDVKGLVDEAVKKAFNSAEEYLRDLKCQLKK